MIMDNNIQTAEEYRCVDLQMRKSAIDQFSLIGQMKEKRV